MLLKKQTWLILVISCFTFVGGTFVAEIENPMVLAPLWSLLNLSILILAVILVIIGHKNIEKNKITYFDPLAPSLYHHVIGYAGRGCSCTIRTTGECVSHKYCVVCESFKDQKCTNAAEECPYNEGL